MPRTLDRNDARPGRPGRATFGLLARFAFALSLCTTAGFAPQALRRPQAVSVGAGGDGEATKPKLPPPNRGTIGKKRARERLERQMIAQGLVPPPAVETKPEAAEAAEAAAPDRLAGTPAAPAAVLEGAPVEIPARWKKVHECERPKRWRESMSDAECAAFTGEEEEPLVAPPAPISLPPGELAAAAAASPPEAGKAAKAAAKDAAAAAANATSSRAPPPSTNYKDLVPQLVSLKDFIEANAISNVRDRLVVVKFYSRQCQACMKIAALYRRLAIDFEDDVDCFEVESIASRPLVRFLNVTKVPSVQVFDPQGLIRLTDSPCMPGDFDKVRHKIDVARSSIKRKRAVHSKVAISYEEELNRINEFRKDIPRGSLR